MQQQVNQKPTQFPHGKYLVLTTGSHRGEIRFQVPMEQGVIKSPDGKETPRVTLVTGIVKKGAVNAVRLTGFGNVISPVVEEVTDTAGWRVILWDEIAENHRNEIARRAINLVTDKGRMSKKDHKETYRQKALSATK